MPKINCHSHDTPKHLYMSGGRQTCKVIVSLTSPRRRPPGGSHRCNPLSRYCTMVATAPAHEVSRLLVEASPTLPLMPSCDQIFVCEPHHQLNCDFDEKMSKCRVLRTAIKFIHLPPGPTNHLQPPLLKLLSLSRQKAIGGVPVFSLPD